MPPRWGVTTVEKLAVNAVMAGCLPEHLPVIIATVEALLAEPFNLYGVQATTHPCAPLVIVAGGPGKHSCVIPSFGGTRAVTRPVRPPRT